MRLKITSFLFNFREQLNLRLLTPDQVEVAFQESNPILLEILYALCRFIDPKTKLLMQVEPIEKTINRLYKRYSLEKVELVHMSSTEKMEMVEQLMNMALDTDKLRKFLLETRMKKIRLMPECILQANDIQYYRVGPFPIIFQDESAIVSGMDQVIEWLESQSLELSEFKCEMKKFNKKETRALKPLQFYQLRSNRLQKVSQ